jgi:O-antigen/teichoic acid export membrane protein
MMGINFLALLLTQLDKILLSKLLTLSEYGYYTLATAVAGTLYMLTGPITQAWFPRLSELYAANNQTELITKFHQGAQLVSVFMGSAAFVMIAFDQVLLQLWTRDAELVQRSAHLVCILALGTLLNGLMWIPYQTQLAHGWTQLATWTNVVSVIIIVPAILWATPRYGAEGAAWVWVSLNAGYVLIAIHFMFRKILTQEKWRWFGQDLLQPLFSAAAVASISAWAMPSMLTAPLQLVWLLIASALTVLASALSAPAVRSALLVQVRLRFKSNGLSTAS